MVENWETETLPKIDCRLTKKSSGSFFVTTQHTFCKAELGERKSVSFNIFFIFITFIEVD